MEQEKRKGYKTSKQQLEANKRYLENNPEAKEKNRYYSRKSVAKNFINSWANLEDLEILKNLIDERINEM